MDQDDDGSDEDVWSSMPTLDEPPKKSKYVKHLLICKFIYNSRAQKICQIMNELHKMYRKFL